MVDRKRRLSEFVRFVTAHLDQTESIRLSHMVENALDRNALDDSIEDEDQTFEALHDGIMDCYDGDDPRGQTVFIELDWKAREEIAWQVNECLNAFSSGEHWELDCSAEFNDVPQALYAVAEWLEKKGYTLLDLNTNCDYYFCFILRTSDVAHAKNLALEAELTLREKEIFLE